MDQGVLERDAGCSLNKLLRQLVAQPVCHREWHEGREREQHNEMLARVEEFDGDDDKLLVEYQQDIDIDIGIESELPELEFDQELKDCAEEPRRVLRRVLRRESLRGLVRAWLRVQVCFRESLRGSFRVWLRVCVQVCLERMLCQSSGKSVECRQTRLQEDACTSCPQQCCSGQNKCKCRQRQFQHAVGANHTVEVWKTTSSYTDAAKLKQVELWQLEKRDVRSKSWKARDHSAGSTCWCKT